MKGKTKLAFAFVVLALMVVSFFTFISTTEAQTGEDTFDVEDTRSYGTCGGLEGCRTSCGCGCLGNPTACGCGG